LNINQMTEMLAVHAIARWATCFSLSFMASCGRSGRGMAKPRWFSR
jgi:hypothetical protein